MAAVSKPPLLYQITGRTSETDRTPRKHATTQSGRDSYLARPPAVHDTSSDARSWSRQTEDALDAYKQLGEKHRPVVTDQTTEIIYNPTVGRERDYEKSFEEKTGVQVTNYRLDSGASDIQFVEPKQQSEKSASGYYANYLEAAELDNDMDQSLEARPSPPKNHRMTRMIVREDIEFFEALLEGHDPPPTTGETQAFVRDETETHRHSQEVRDREADKRREEEAQAAKADTDFFMMLMGRE